MPVVLQARKNVGLPGTTLAPAAVSLTSGWTTGAGGATYTPVAGDMVQVWYNIGTDLASDTTVNMTTADYTRVGAELYGGDNASANAQLFRKFMGSTPDTTVQVGATGNNAWAGCYTVEVWSGVDPADPDDVAPTTASGINGAVPNPSAITPLTPGTVIAVYAAGAATTGAVFTQSGSELSNFLSTNQTDTVDSFIGAGNFAWTSGTFDPVAWTGGVVGTAPSWVSITVALKPISYSMTAAPGSYSYTGTAANLVRGLLVSAAPGSYTYTGTAATLTKSGGLTHYSMTAEELLSAELNPDTGFDNPGQWIANANWSVTGSKAVAAGVSGTGLSRTDIAVTAGRRYVYSYTLSSYSSGDFYARVGNTTNEFFSANGTHSGSITVVGASQTSGMVAVGGATGQVDDLSIKAAGYFITGTDASFLKGRTVTAGPGTYTLTGTAAGLLFNRLITAAPGTYSLTGTAANLARGRTMTADPGAYTYTGTAANLRESAIAMPADPGSYALTGTAVNFLKGRTIAADPGSYALTGTAAGFLRTRVMPAAAGSYTLTGTAATLARSRSMTAVPGSYTLTGTAAGFLYGRRMPADPGAYAYTGTDADLVVINSYSMAADPGSYLLTGSAATFVIGTFQYWVVEPDPAGASIAGEADPASAAWAVEIDPVVAVLAGATDPAISTWLVEAEPTVASFLPE